MTIWVPSWAANFVWTGGGADANWSTPANWSGGSAPANDGTAAIVLTGTTQLAPNVDAAWNISSLSFSNGAGAFVLGGSPLNLRAGGVTNNSATGQIINNAITLANGQSWNASSNTLTFNGTVNNGTNALTVAGNFNSLITGAISGTGGLTKTGAGTLTLTASNSYGGLTTISAGVLNIQHSSALGGTASGTTIASGAALQLQGGISVAGETLSLNGSGIASSGALRNLSGSNSWSGTITLTAAATINAEAGTLDLEANLINAAFTTTFTNSGTILLNGVLGNGSGACVKNGTGLLALGGTNAFTGSTTLNAGTVRCGAVGSLGNASAVTVNSNSLLDLNGFNQTILSLTGGGGVTLSNATLTVGGSAATTFSGVLSGAGGLVKVGTGTLTLSGGNTYTGGTTINAGAISIAAATGLGNATNALTLNGGTLTTSASLTSARAITLSASGGIFSPGRGTLTLSGVLSGPGTLTKSGSRRLTLTGTNTYLGGTTIAGGTINLSNNVALGDAAGTLTFSASGTLATTASFSSPRNVLLNAVTATFNCGTGFTNTWNGVLSGAGAFTKAGSGVLVLGGSNTYTNLTTLSAGTLRLGADERLSDLTPLLITSSSASLDLNGFKETIGSLATTAAGTVTLRNGSLTAGGNNLSTTNAAVISGNGGFTKAGTGTMIFTGANTYTNATIIAAGTLQLGLSERIANTSPLVISNGATFNLTRNGTNYSETVASLAGGGSVILGTGTLTAGNASNNTFSGIISGPGAFTKVGAGTQVFSGTNAYSGATTVSVGNLQVNGSSPNSAVTIASAAILSGNGTVGAVTVNAGATNAPGVGAPGTLSSGAQTWAGGGNYVWEINNAAGTKGGNSGWDWLNLSGALTITANSGSKFNLKLVSLTPGNVPGTVINFDNTVTYIWTIATASGGISGFDPTKINLLTTGFQNPPGAGNFSLSQSGNDLNLVFTAAPLATVQGVQRGTVTSTGTGTNTVTLATAVNPTNAFLLFNTRHNSSVPGGSMLRGRIASPTTVEFVRATTETSPINVQWYVVEYAAGIRVQRGEVNQTNTILNVPLAPLTSVSQAFVTCSKTPDSTATTFSDSDPVVGELTATTNLQLRVSSAPSAGPVISWQVIEFLNPVSLDVQKGSVTNLTGTNLVATAALATPVNTNSTFLLAGYRTSGSGTSIGARLVRAQLTDASTVTFDRSIAGAPDDIAEIFWQAVQLNDGSAVQRGSVNFASGSAQTNVALPTSLNTNRAAAFASAQPAGGQNTGRSPSLGTVLGVGSTTLALTSATQLTLDRNNTSDASDIGWFVVGFGPSALLTAATGGAAISADTTTNLYTGLIGPSYTEIQNGNLGAGTITLQVPAGFIFDTNAPAPTVLLTRVGGSGVNALNLNGVASGTAMALTTVNSTNLTFTVTSASSGGVTCSLLWQNVRVRPTAGTPLASGALTSTGTSIIQGVIPNSTSWGLLGEVVGTAAKLAFVAPPSSAVIAGADFPQQPVVQILDQFGNLRTSDSTNVVTATSSGTDTDHINGDVTAVGGVATFSGMDYEIVQTNTITFSAVNLQPITSGNIVVSPAAASQLTILTQPSLTATAGILFAQQPVVRVEDAFGNLRTADNSTVVTADANQGLAALLGTINVTAKNGLATFTNLAYPIAESITIDFTNATLNPDTSASIVVNPASQTITFGVLANKIYGAAPFALSASASSGLPVAFSIASGPATVLGNLVTLTGAGTVTVRASQPGDATYAAALPVDQSFTVSKANSSLAVATSANPAPTGANITFTATASSSAGTPTGTVQFLLDGTAWGVPAGLSGGSASVSSASLAHGPHAITAQYAGDGNFSGSTNLLDASQLINSPPVASLATYARPDGTSWKISIANLATNWSDVDGDVIELTSVDSFSTNGVSVTQDNVYLYYNSTNATSADSFSYVISDVYAATATGTVNLPATVSTNNLPVVLNLIMASDGVPTITFAGIPARTYYMRASTNLVDWTTINTNVADVNGVWQFTDGRATNYPTRYYRSSDQP